MMAACSKDDVVSIQQDGIAYSVSAQTQTRAADSYCNNVLPDCFKVWAKSNDGLYINGDKIVNNSGVWTDMDGTRYWPDDKSLDFYAEVNGDNEFSFNNGVPTFNDFVVKDDVTEQVDLMYSVRKNQTKSVDKVQLNFRHALSQVCFRAKNNMKNMSVVIKGVSVGHLTNGGTFTFPATDTDYNYENHTDNPDNYTLNGGTWAIPADAQYEKQYDVKPLNGDVTLAPNTAFNLTCPEDEHVNGFAQVLTLLPQTVEAWNPRNAEKRYDGAYFLIDLVLSNITKDDAGAEVSTTVYDGKAAVPVRVAWEQGYRYIYTFVFDEGGNGGWTPYPDDPKPVLTTIKYDVTVDDFIPANGDGDGTKMDTGDDEDPNPNPNPDPDPINPGNTDNWGGDDNDPSFTTSDSPTKVADADGWTVNVDIYGNGGFGSYVTYNSNGLKNDLLTSKGGSAYFFQWGRWLGFPAECINTHFNDGGSASGDYPNKKQYLNGVNIYNTSLGYIWDSGLIVSYASCWMGNNSWTNERVLNCSIIFGKVSGITVNPLDYAGANEICKWEDRCGNPCPDGYRIPTASELEVLIPSTGVINGSFAEVKEIGGVKYAMQWKVNTSATVPCVEIRSVKTTENTVSVDDAAFNSANVVRLPAYGYLDNEANFRGRDKTGVYWSCESGANTMNGTNGNGGKYLEIDFNGNTAEMGMDVAPRSFGACVLPIKDPNAKASSITPWFPLR